MMWFWVISGIVGWVYFLILTRPKGMSEFLFILFFIIPAVVAGPFTIVTIAISNRINPLDGSRK